MDGSEARILVYGNFEPQNFEFGWLKWLQEQGYNVSMFERGGGVRRFTHYRWPRRILWRFASGLLAYHESRWLVGNVCSLNPDLVLIVSGNLVTSSALRAIKAASGATLFHFYNEDFFNTRNTTPCLQEAAAHYDKFFTTKSYNVQELKNQAIDQAIYVPHGYRENCHYPVDVSQTDVQQYGSDVVFAGTFESPRTQMLESVAGFDLRIWGIDWHKLPRRSPLRKCVQGRAAYCEELSRVFNGSKICLAFLRRKNRDLHASRTFEIPACGGFQLSERTEEILSFFEEGKEIECFSSVEELKDKVTYYLAHEAQRRRIATAGLERVRRSRYSFTDRLQTILGHYYRLRPR